MKIENLDFSKLKAGTWSKARGHVSLLFLPYILIGISKSIFSEYYQIVIVIIFLSIVWGGIWESSNRFNKLRLPTSLQRIPILSLLIAIGACFALYGNYDWIAIPIILFAMCISFLSAILAINEPE